MTISEAMKKLGYDLSKQVYGMLNVGLTLDTDIGESGLKVNEKLCIPGSGVEAVRVEVQKYDDWGYSRPWISFFLDRSQIKFNPTEWLSDTKWIRPEDLEV